MAGSSDRAHSGSLMVPPRARRGDDDLGPMTDRTDRVESRAVTATSDILSTSLHLLDRVCIMILVHRGLPPSHPLYLLGPVLLPHHTIRTPPYHMTLMNILNHHKHHMIHMHMFLLCLSVHSSSSSLLGPSRWTHLTIVLTIEPLIMAIPYLMLGQASHVEAKELSGCCLSIPDLLPSWCIDDYMPWFLSRTHPRIQNPDRLPYGVQLPTVAPITPHVLLDMISRELNSDDIDDTTKVGRASDMIKKYHHSRYKFVVLYT
ncbi:hypothetical protein M9H77_26125 [Catharanthus roseus]|uniref:Uncharacterized protein n=1 Tax=Catharanthus roseus TaxID=4058 RepID=A0ACC0ABI6_CATRO|nr:hypothetical protein M9H77_26125 [Catharanthus roseus]